MTATYTFDVFSSLDGFGSYGGDWAGYWGKQGPELLAHRQAVYCAEPRMVLGATTFREFLADARLAHRGVRGPRPSVTRMPAMPTTVVSSTLNGPLDWPNASIVRGDAVEVVARLKGESDVPLRSHGSLSMNRALMAAGLVDRVEVRCSRSSGVGPEPTRSRGHGRPRPRAGGDPDLDRHIQELVYRPTLHA